jgi:aspartyl-tRNA(Asn)/glutamyl-tRNA(Gln) amidotransferase subunit A
MLQAIAGYDQLDPASVDVPIPAYGHAFELETSKLRLGIPRSPFFENLDPEVANATEAGLAVLRKITTHVADVSLLQSFPATFPLFLTIVGPEALAYHAKSVVEFPNRYQPLTRERLTQAINTNAAAYAGALHQTYLVRREIKSIFSSIDLLVTPTMPKPAETFAESKSFDQFGLQNTSPSMCTGYPQSLYLVASPVPDYRSASKSLVRHGRRRRFSRSRTPISAKPSGTKAVLS